MVRGGGGWWLVAVITIIIIMVMMTMKMTMMMMMMMMMIMIIIIIIIIITIIIVIIINIVIIIIIIITIPIIIIFIIIIIIIIIIRPPYLGFLRLGRFGSATTRLSGYLSLDSLYENRAEHITIGLLYVMLRFFTRCWCHGLINCLLYAGPRFGDLVWNDSRCVSLTQWRPTLSLLWIMFAYMYLHIS